MAKETEIYRPSGKADPTNAIRGERQEPKPRMRVKGTAADKIGAVYEDVERFGHSRMIPFSVGHVEKRMREFAERHGIEIADGDLYMSASSLQHARRDEKIAAGIDVSVEDMKRFPSERKNMDLYYDTSHKNFIYVDGRNKFIINPRGREKINRREYRKVNLVTGERLGVGESFNGRIFIRVV